MDDWKNKYKEKVGYYMNISESSREILEDDEKQAAGEALMIVFDNHMQQVLEVRHRYPMDILSVLSREIGNRRDVPKQFKQSMTGLHSRIHNIIAELAINIETMKYVEIAQIENDPYLPKQTKDKAIRLFTSDMTLHISCQTIRLVVDYFQKINKDIIRRIETIPSSENSNKEFTLVMGNAVLIYELVDFVINYMDHFKLDGKQDILDTYAEMHQSLDTMKENAAKNRQAAQQPEISESMRKRVLDHAQSIESAAEIIDAEWRSYIESAEDMEKSIQLARNQRADLDALRSMVKSQLEMMNAIGITRLINEHLQDLSIAVNALESIELVELSPGRVRRLLNISTSEKQE